MQVDAIVHREKRANIPTSDAQEFLDPAIEKLDPIEYPRTSMSPQLVWNGKQAQNERPLLVDAPPLFIQEKIAPRVLIENLRRAAQKPDDEPELSLFDEFDGLDELSAIEFYQHESNWSNRMILGDSLQAMGSLAEREDLRGKVQMIYIDPPYGIKFNSNWQVKVDKRDIKDGKDTAREVEQIKAFRDTWAGGIGSYLSYLRDRLMVARDLLTDSGSCFVQIGDDNVHLVRALMDEVFGGENFVSQITFKKTSGAGSPSGGTDVLASVCDFIVWYARDASKVKYRQLYQRKSIGGSGATQYTLIENADGTRRTATAQELAAPPAGARIFSQNPLTSQSSGAPQFFNVTVEGRQYSSGSSGWKTTRAGMEKLGHARRLYPIGKNVRYVRYFDDFPVYPFSNTWDDTLTSGFGDPKIYVVQTNTLVVSRCMLMCTDPGDLVLDPTCGSGTTAYVAEQWGRRWITMDTSRVALTLARQRLMTSKFPYYLLADSIPGREKEAADSGQAAALNGAVTNDIRHGFVYQRVQHVTLKSIANNPDIVEGMSREEIDAAIKRHADFEYLYDRPYEDKKRVRVTGPFTVESLSPYRSASFSDEGPLPEAPTISERIATVDPENPDYAQSILDNLARAGIQNGKRAERIEFASVESHAGKYIQAIGERAGSDDAVAPSKIALAIGPQYGTVGTRFVRDAVNEAIADPDVDLLCVLGFAFDPKVTGVTEEDGITVVASDDGFANVAGERKLGRLPTLMVRMNADLLMGEELAKTSKANLFTVFGEPDIEVATNEDGDLVVDLHGVDVYDPTTGQIRSQETDPVVLWMIDTEYDGDSFFVRHCYFTGGNDPYKRLRTALKADIDEEAWASLYRTQSRPFPRPTTGRIAVKVINDYGDEVMKVIDLERRTEQV